MSAGCACDEDGDRAWLRERGGVAGVDVDRDIARAGGHSWLSAGGEHAVARVVGGMQARN
ncbi:hypothetical protein [Nocardia nepalensis]|uniref:hypothetical protein n=1 Tax=Nocardia nepalensis TaxID=3375448 RepID=UPI003B6781F2